MSILIVILLLYIAAVTTIALTIISKHSLTKKQGKLKKRFTSVVAVNVDLRPYLTEKRCVFDMPYAYVYDRAKVMIAYDGYKEHTGRNCMLTDGGVVALGPPCIRAVCIRDRESHIVVLIREYDLNIIPHNTMFNIMKNKTCEGEISDGKEDDRAGAQTIQIQQP